jgi:uncharacterized RDD family membrane protein YckC
MTYGGFWIRVLAYLVDMVVLFTLLVVLGFGAMYIGDIASLVMMPVFLLGPTLYFVLLHASKRQATFGKSLLGLKVGKADGERLSLARSFGRELAKIISAIPLAIGFLLAAFTGRKQALHDYVASTVVVRDGRGNVLLGVIVGVFGWTVPAALAMSLGLGVLAASMGVTPGAFLQEAMKEPQKPPAVQTAQPAKPAPEAPKPAPAVVVEAPKPPVVAPPPPAMASAIKLQSVHLYQSEAEMAPRLGGDATALGTYIKAIEQRFVQAGTAMKGAPRSFGVAVVVKPEDGSRSWLIPGPGADREVAALYGGLQGDIAKIEAPRPSGGPVGFALAFSVHGGKPDRRVTVPMPPSWTQSVRKEKPADFDAMVQAVWPDPRTAAVVAKVPEQAPVEQAKPVEAPKAAEPMPVVVIPGPTYPGPKYNDLMTAVLYADTDAVNHLLSLGRWADKPDSRGTTPVTAAAMMGDVKTAEVLLKAGANAAPAIPVARERRDRAMTSLLERYAK